jgi:uncharacterized protein (DUF427 family)
MAVRMRDHFRRGLGELRFEPTGKRIRVRLGGDPVADTVGALLVWEPGRVWPWYAVPDKDLEATLEAAAPATPDPAPAGGPPAVGPFAEHTTPGTAHDVRAGENVRPAAAYRIGDDDLAGYTLLDFAAFTWFEEDEPVLGHPRDPYHRVDLLSSSRSIRVEAGGQVLAESTRPLLVFETNLPVRFYLPREDVRIGLLAPSPTRTYCPYKGRASYWSVDGGDESQRDVAWTYGDPLPDAQRLAGMVAFYDERVDITVDGQRRERPHTIWS